ncbi:uncharacterized protein F4812DRAFT_419232 [Daldinia caldariorum]|uniref:uncharacterized protein n=1 Tax=Daldinia caldariorum TaxID=326644 RepID=UPI002007E388|nr:uncharacterized protein F4812DRAFT_419232 [Daldinia caldariorum]KAI1470847.1 hypothetical protein F4812DRAFT_419232 [Daldinia caldariorum]
MTAPENFPTSLPRVECLIQNGLKSRILMPADPAYAARIDSYWCNSAKLRPSCIVQPRSADDVSKAVVALAKANQPLAVRSGGHTNWAGSNNITDGVTIDLGLLNSTRYDDTNQTAHIGSGGKWKHVYAELEKHGRTVAGGREAEVGVGGFLLGGGNNFYASRYGLACDCVIAYEVVLADGSIVTAKADEHTDLFRALKGGGNNFGIVTCFTMSTIPSGPIWGGLALHPLDIFPAGIKTVVDFTTNNATDPDSSMQFVVGYQPRFGGGVCITIANNMAAVEKPPLLQAALALPEIMSNYKTTTLQEVLTYSSLPPNYYNIWFTLTIKNDASILVKAAELHNQMTKELQAGIPDQDFTSHVAFQPLPRLFVERSHATNASGNVLGLEQNTSDAILIQACASVRTAELEAWARPKVRALVDEVRAFASNIEGGVVPWVYLNYAHSSQEVLQSYGPENIRRLREASSKYDPEGIFQRLCPGGFKISALKN